MGQKKKEVLAKFNQENILSAAKKLFEDKGIVATTMDDIAKEADYSKSTMYVYFKSKEEIIQHIILESMIQLKDLIKGCVNSETDYKDCFFAICKELQSFSDNHPVIYELLLSEILVTKEDIIQKNVRGQIYEAGEEVNVLIEDLLKCGIEQGKVRNDIKIIETVFFLWSGISEVIRFAKQKEGYFIMRLGISKEEYMEYACSLLLHSIES